jgi:hypothetical protein
MREIATLQNYSVWNGIGRHHPNNISTSPPELLHKPPLLYIPYRKYTSGLVHLHNPNNPEDCTHFCHTPYLWMPIWHHLNRGMQKFVALYHHHPKQHPSSPS